MPTTDPFAKPLREWGANFVDISACPIGAVGVTELGEVWCWGEVPYAGDLAGAPLPTAVGGVELTGTGRGYWVWLVDGTIAPFGDAPDVGPRRQVPR